MYELIPILGGVALGALAALWGPRTGRAILVAVGAVALGIGAAVLSGEIEESWAFLVWDTAQAAIAAVLTAWLVRRVRAPQPAAGTHES